MGELSMSRGRDRDVVEKELRPQYVWKDADDTLGKEVHALGMTVGRLHRRLTPVLSARMERAEVAGPAETFR